MIFRWFCGSLTRRLSLCHKKAKFTTQISLLGIENRMTLNKRDKISLFLIQANSFSNKSFAINNVKYLCTETANIVAKKKNIAIGMLRSILDEPDKYLNYDGWMELKLIWEDENKIFDERRMVFEEKAMSLICSKKYWQLANSLYLFSIQSEFKLTPSLMNSYLYVCVAAEKRDEILSIYEWFMAHPKIPDAATLKNIVNGLSLTDRWKESLEHLKNSKGTTRFSSTAFNSVVCTACFYKDYDVAESLFNNMVESDMLIQDTTFVALLQAYDGQAGDQDWGKRCKRMAEKILKIFRGKRTLPSMAIAEALQEWFNRLKFEEWESEVIKFDNKNHCPRCGTRLETLKLTNKEFDNLHKQVTEKVIHGNDIFRKTSPKELATFVKFVDEGAPYDVVIDGLNVALVQFNKTLPPSKLLLNVVQYLVQHHGYKCLVLGRRHMIKRWNRSDMQALMDCADCFFTEDVSEDDPFMLYATLHSGQNALYVTRDMFRDHKALLDHETHVSFIKWQRGHQLAFINFKRGKPHFKACRVEDTITQSTSDTWHVPIDAGDSKFAYQLPNTWLCVNRKS